MKKYDKIPEFMTFEEAKEILGYDPTSWCPPEKKKRYEAYSIVGAYEVLERDMMAGVTKLRYNVTGAYHAGELVNIGTFCRSYGINPIAVEEHLIGDFILIWTDTDVSQIYLPDYVTVMEAHI